MDPAEDERSSRSSSGRDPFAPSVLAVVGSGTDRPRGCLVGVHRGRYAAPGRPRAPPSPALVVWSAAAPAAPVMAREARAGAGISPSATGSSRGLARRSRGGLGARDRRTPAGPAAEPARSRRSGPLLGDRRGLGGTPLDAAGFPTLGGPRPSVGQHPERALILAKLARRAADGQHRLLPRSERRALYGRCGVRRSGPVPRAGTRRTAGRPGRAGTAHRHGGRPAPTDADDERRLRQPATPSSWPPRRHVRPRPTCATRPRSRPSPGPPGSPSRRPAWELEPYRASHPSSTPCCAGGPTSGSRRPSAIDGRRACRDRRPAPGHVVGLRQGRRAG